MPRLHFPSSDPSLNCSSLSMINSGVNIHPGTTFMLLEGSLVISQITLQKMIDYLIFDQIKNLDKIFYCKRYEFSHFRDSF